MDDAQRRDELRKWMRESLIELTFQDVWEFCPLYEDQWPGLLELDLRQLLHAGLVKKKEIWYV